MPHTRKKVVPRKGGEEHLGGVQKNPHKNNVDCHACTACGSIFACVGNNPAQFFLDLHLKRSVDCAVFFMGIRSGWKRSILVGKMDGLVDNCPTCKTPSEECLHPDDHIWVKKLPKRILVEYRRIHGEV